MGISMVEICGNHMKNMGIFRPKSWWYPWGYDDWRWFGSENGVYTMKCGHWIGKIMIDHWFLGYPMLRQTLYTIYIYMTISSDIVWKILLRQQHVWFSQELSTTCIFWGWFTHDAHGLQVASLGLSKHWNTRTFCTWPSKPLFHSKHLPRNPLVCPHSNNTSKQ